MLMFDSSIFATFIPQILMVLGFISCIVAPKFTAKTSTLEITNEVKVIHFQENKEKECNVAHFYHYKKAEKNSGLIKFQEHFSPTLAVVKINFPDLVIQWKKIEILSTLFSRPPPVF